MHALFRGWLPSGGNSVGEVPGTKEAKRNGPYAPGDRIGSRGDGIREDAEGMSGDGVIHDPFCLRASCGLLNRGCKMHLRHY